jgi:hypothetical protein
MARGLLIRINNLGADSVSNGASNGGWLMTTLDTSHARMNGVAAGWALSAVLVVFFLICTLLAIFWPIAAFGQGWVALFATPPDGSIATLVGGMLGSIVIAWFVTGVFVGVHNYLLSRSKN